MASTKIINVLKDDKFEEIFDLFRNTSAKEVIFVLPKTSRAFKNEEHFVILENEANKSGKKISLLCSNPETNNFAKKYNFDVLLAKSENQKPSTDDEDIEQEEELEPKEEEDTEESEDQIASKLSPAMYQKNDDESRIITIATIRKGLSDIIKQGGIPLKIVTPKERPISL